MPIHLPVRGVGQESGVLRLYYYMISEYRPTLRL